LDDKERVILFNPTAEKILGIHTHQISGLTLASALPALRKPIQSVAQMDPIVNVPPFMDILYRKPDGAKIYLRLSISPLRYLSTEKGGEIIVFQDVTE